MGVLALQGDVMEHRRALEQAPRGVPVRSEKESARRRRPDYPGGRDSVIGISSTGTN